MPNFNGAASILLYTASVSIIVFTVLFLIGVVMFAGFVMRMKRRAREAKMLSRFYLLRMLRKFIR